jgi:superfamily I DNA/RNA helicase
MPFLLHDSQLTREQRAIVELRPDRHHLVLGPPGSGKTQVLLHRARWLRDRANTPPDRFRIFVFTNVLSQFIRQSLDYLAIPPGTVQTFDDWCGGLWETLVGGRKPKVPAPGIGLDYPAIRRGVAVTLHKSPVPARLLDFAMVDEGQDLDAYAYQILRAAVTHVSVFADARQQIFEGGLGEAEILTALGVAQQTASLLPAYRNSPDVAKLASYFGNHFDGLNYTAKDRQRPCFYVAADWDDEIDQMAIIIREQMRLNHKVCIIVPTNRDLYGVAKRLGERGVPVEKATPPRGGGPPADFNTLTPKIATYHSAKGLTFDCVILPKLVENNFLRVTGPRRHRLLLVGITRATQWVYLSTVRGYELKEVALLREAEAKGDLFVLTSAKSETVTAPPPAEEPVAEDSFL